MQSCIKIWVLNFSWLVQSDTLRVETVLYEVLIWYRYDIIKNSHHAGSMV